MTKPKTKRPKKDPAAWDRLVDQMAALDNQHPYLSQMGDAQHPVPPAGKKPKR